MSSSFESTLDAVLGRVAEVTGARSDAVIARELGVRPQSLANWRSRGSIPYQKLSAFAEKYELTLDYVLLGRQPKHVRRREIDSTLLASIAGLLEGRLRQESAEIQPLVSIEFYFYVGLVYNRLLLLPSEVQHGAISGEIDLLVTVMKAKAGDSTEIGRQMENSTTRQSPRETGEKPSHRR